MKYSDYPTWRMLEKSKAELSYLISDINKSLNDIPMFMRGEIEHTARHIQEQHNKIVQLQLALEDRLCQDSSL